MFFIVSALLLVNTSVITHSYANVEGDGNAHTFVQSTVNGNTTTVESNQPGSISVEKTDTSETITSDHPVTVTHTTSAPMTPEPPLSSEPTITASQPAIVKYNPVAARYSLVSLLRNLWDRVKSILSFGLLTQK